MDDQRDVGATGRSPALDDQRDVGAVREPPVLTLDEAKALPEDERVEGVKVKGSVMPFGGSWSYDKDADVLTLVEAPSRMPQPAEKS